MEHDYIVIGGGHNGLVAANYLAKAGHSVVVLEQCDFLGGMTATQPFAPRAPNHLLSKGAIDAVFMRTTKIVEELGLAKYGLEWINLDPAYGWVDEDGETLFLFTSPERTAADIARFSKTDASRYLDMTRVLFKVLEVQQRFFNKSISAVSAADLAKTALTLIGDRAMRKLLMRLVSVSAYEAIEETYESEALRGLHAYWGAIACPADVDGSGIYLSALAMCHRAGCSRPRGGMGGLIGALERGLVDHGGTARTGAAVEEILVADGRARGVRLWDGGEITARHGVLASCAPQVTYGRLLKPEAQSLNSRKRLPHMPANSNNMCPFKVDMALAGTATFTKAQQRRKRLDGLDIGGTSLMTGTLAEHMEHAAALRLGKIGPKPPIWMTVLSAADASLAPTDQSVIYLYGSAPWEPEGGWENQAQTFANRLVLDASRYLDGLDTELDRCVTTPKDFEREFGAPRGCLYHVDMLPTRLGPNRPASGMGGGRTEISNLYIAGSGTHPAGGVFGMPGRLAAMGAMPKTFDD